MNVRPEKGSLETSIIAAPASTAAIYRLLELFWGACPTGCMPTSYLEYYAQQCDSFFVEQSESGQIAADTTGYIETHQQLADTASRLVAGSQTREDIVSDIAAHAPTQAFKIGESIENSVNWAARAVTCTEIGVLRCAFSSRRPLLWQHGSLREFLADVFGASKPVNTHIRLEKNFNALNLERLSGITVEWTSDLSSHLSLREDDTKVMIFHQATFLESVKHDLFPVGLCEETIRTLALLLPASDRDVQRWYRKQQSANSLDPEAVRCRKLRADDRQIANFHFWAERLSILKQVFDEAEPKTLSQWWFDRRKGPQWYTFWVAIAVLALTVFFGVVQSIEGALQVYKAYHPS
ncbi:unnamed protein product [Zymoseptoria tritici ST99CH_1A5]|uniref:Uncharacterized protein n=1 Tax=Zymoseptoria tritici ST99CH_1A5 TaxID=1276529 RepID=A0A1Y6LMS2_ZYMTR|nr:unnamed protein product [Zymoseptoria tritici ST99CH_3D1]SMY25737.1 unnamed protein product [Zymoseptoria tritici ST99CH_1A5]